MVGVAVALGFILLIKGGGVGFQTDSQDVKIGEGSNKTTTTEPAVPTTTTPSTSVAPATLKVVVLNGAGLSGYAATAANFLGLAGYPNIAAKTAAAQVQTTTVYYAPGYEGDAKAIAKLLSIGAVKPLPTGTVLGKVATDVPTDTNVVIVLGPDVEGIINPAGASTTTVAGSSSPGNSTVTTTAGSAAASTIPSAGTKITTTTVKTTTTTG
ncbi:LytR cell envelope-like transcriptional attenuator [Actinobacteria bacterium IMCC26207]|nr:LytR cell envelope-like transcriptional attenuator [Actinobacteria bacterium IMCC26207]